VARERERAVQIEEAENWLYRLGLVELTPSANRIVRVATLQKALADSAIDVPAASGSANMDLEVYWTLAETAVWALTRDASRVAAMPRSAGGCGLNPILSGRNNQAGTVCLASCCAILISRRYRTVVTLMVPCTEQTSV
jgi:hypothetical protein